MRCLQVKVPALVARVPNFMLQFSSFMLASGCAGAPFFKQIGNEIVNYYEKVLQISAGYLRCRFILAILPAATKCPRDKCK